MKKYQLEYQREQRKNKIENQKDIMLVNLFKEEKLRRRKNRNKKKATKKRFEEKGEKWSNYVE